MSQSYTVFSLMEARSPITHMAKTAGNEAIVAREPIVTERGVVWIPYLSGNAIRHRMIREPGVRWLVDQYDLQGKLSVPQLNFLFHGGNLTEGGGRENTARIAEMQRVFPLIRLLGGCLPDQILSGSLLCGRGKLVCEENLSTIHGMLPKNYEMPQETLRNAESYVSGYQYTRSDARKSVPALMNGQEESESSLMIFSGQAIVQGACFVHEFVLRHVCEIELGALLFSLQLWQQSGAFIGGQSARGHGQLQLMVHSPLAVEMTIQKYKEYALSMRIDAVKWLDSCFAKKEPKTPKPKKEKEAKA